MPGYRFALKGHHSMAEIMPTRNIAVALMLTGLSGLATLLLLSALGPDWGAYTPATCTTTHCFCELPRDGALVVQPANSWSSFGYVLVGFLLILQAGKREMNAAMRPLAMITLGITAIIVGVGSALLHATLTLWGQFFDVVGMYLVGSFLLVNALARWRNISDGRAAMLYAALCAILVAILIIQPEVRRWLFSVLLLLAIVAELALARPLRPGARLGYYWSGLLVMAAGFGIWILDQQGVVCTPNSLLQGHALWHILGAASLWLTSLYYRSEHRTMRPATMV